MSISTSLVHPRHTAEMLSRRIRDWREQLPYWLRTGAAIVRHRRATADGQPNPIAVENRHRGSRRRRWDISGAGDLSLQGFSTEISIAAGEIVEFKIATDAPAYRIEIFRLGYYRGRGARKVAEVLPDGPLPQIQPHYVTDAATGLVDCGNWATSARWTVPDDAVSGIYLAKLTRPDTGGSSHIPFVIRDTHRRASIVFQTADQTWHAYNRFGGADFYTGSETDRWDSPSRARKVSYNRPILTRGDEQGRSFLFSSEYCMVRFLERNGYDVSYVSGVDVARSAGTLAGHDVYLSVGHDEYWSQQQRLNVERARDAGVHLMFLSGNEMYWRTRFERSLDASRQPYRTLVCYKETWDGVATDPGDESTATWRDQRFLRPGQPDLGPENAVTGTLCMANESDFAIAVSATEGQFRLWRGTGLDSMRSQQVKLAPHTVGYESDEDVDNGCRPAGLIRLSTAVGPSPAHLQDYGLVTAPGHTTHHVTLYRATSGALVFGAGTVQWAWGLDRNHDGVRSAVDVRMQQATVNMLADMGVQAATPMAGLVAAVPSADDQPPTSEIVSPKPGHVVPDGQELTVAGTATDVGGQVAGVEVSVDGGNSWHRATGTTRWSYSWVAGGSGPRKICSRATDDSANTETPRDGIEIVVS